MRVCILTSAKKIIIILIWVSITSINVIAQDVIISVKALQETKAVNLDSIFIVNETNGSVIRVGQLSLIDTIYKINLNTGNIQTTTSNYFMSGNFQISALATSDGVDFIASLTAAQKISATLYTLDGRLIGMKEVNGIAGINRFNMPVNTWGILIANVCINCKSATFKIVKNNNISHPKYQIGRLQDDVVSLKSSESDWVYNEGDRIQLTTQKGSLQSGAWLGRPVDGSNIVVALPKSDNVFNMKQTLSKGAQINTISFSGVAFFSGCFYASTFYPPGKVSDYFGFQYMRDNDYDESGHNTDFLTKAAYLMMNLLNDNQMQILIDLAEEQDSLFNDYALRRLILIKAFHRYLDGDLPDGTTSLNIDSITGVSKQLYLTDAEISYGRAIKFAAVINTFTEEQRDSLYRIGTLGMQSWPMPSKPSVKIPNGLNVLVMSNASELFSWFLCGVDADIYFCPERQGTYFGGFYMKDAPAVGNPGYAIDQEATANKGAYLLDTILNSSQSAEIKSIYSLVGTALNGIVEVRTKISTELRKAIDGGGVIKDSILSWSEQYGAYDAVYIHSMVEQFVKVGRTLTTDQKDELTVLRDLEDYPCKDGKVFLYSSEIDEPVISSTDFLFH